MLKQSVGMNLFTNEIMAEKHLRKERSGKDTSIFVSEISVNHKAKIQADGESQPDLLEQLRNDVNSSNLMENDDQVGQHNEDTFAATQILEDKSSGKLRLINGGKTGMHEPKILKITGNRLDTSGDLANKTSDDFYSKISSIDNNSTLVMDLNSSNLPQFGGAKTSLSEARIAEKSKTFVR